jgi:hypothetical protein
MYVNERRKTQQTKKGINTMANVKMTEREFLNLVINGDINEDVKAYATEGIAKLDAKNEKRKNTPTKEQLANEGLKSNILELLANSPMVASEVGASLGVSTQKASALCQLLVKEGKVSVADIKVKNKGAVKSYSLAEGE